MRRISLAGKMFVNGAILVVPIVLLAAILHLQIGGDVAFARRERVGVAYVAALRQPFYDLETSRTLPRPHERALAARRASRDLELARRATAADAATLDLRDAIADIEARRRRGAAATVVLRDLLALVASASDNSKITLDPILDGYYVGDTMIDKVPNLIDGIAAAGALGSQVLDAGRMSRDGRIAITTFAGQIDDGIARIDHNVPIAVGAAPYLAGGLDDAARRERAASSAFARTLRARILNPVRPRGGAAAYDRSAAVALARAFALDDVAIDAMDDVLRRRIDALLGRERLIFSIVLALTLLAALTAIAITRSIARRLGAVTGAIRTIVDDDMTRLVASANAIARGDGGDGVLAPRPPLDDRGSDEAAVLARSYNALAKRLGDVNADLVRMTTLLSRMAFTDALTGLANRAFFMDRMRATFAGDARGDVAVLFLDLDRFKLVNDSLGHAAGDALLGAVARRLEGLLEPGATLARLGGDEFTFLLESARESGAVAFARRVLEGLARPFDIAGRETFVSASIGIALARDGEGPEDVLRAADLAMYRSKALGKNRYTVFASEYLERASGMLQLDTDLARALERREFVLHYQPIVSLRNGALAGFEALVRWRHPTRGLVGPDAFIPAAEENGTILAIGAQVFDEACRQARRWRDAYPTGRPLPISVNVSARQFSQPTLVDDIKRALETYHLAPSDLHVEVTESAVMGDVAGARAMLEELRRCDIEVHLDDFGTGYSSLGYVQSFPLSTIKIDRSFVSMSGDDLGNPEIVRTILSLAQSLSLRTTAEGIETPRQLARLRALGCTHGQGYLFSKPLVADDATEFIAQDRRTTANLELVV